MRVSVIIPVYNSEKYLKKCIDSVLDQSYSDIEIIAVNDGSNDSSLSILKQYGEKIVIIDKTNGGTASALNAGINTMTGDWFKWLSDDDILEKDAISDLINTARSYEDYSNYIFYSNQNLIDKDGKVIGKVIESNHNDLTHFQQGVILLNKHFGNPNSSLMHKSIFKKCGLLNEKIGYYEDHEFWLRSVLLFNCKLILVPKITLRYRIHSDSLSSNKLIFRFEKHNEIRTLILSKLTNEKQEQFLSALKNYKKSLPFKIKVRSSIRDFLIKNIPKNIFHKILYCYLKIKNKFILSN